MSSNAESELSLLSRTKALRKQRDFAQAEELIESALREAPHNSLLLNALGSIYLDAKKYDKAIETFDQTLSLDPNNEDAFSQKTRAYRQKKMFLEAQGIVTNGLQRLPKSTALLNEQASIHLDRKEYDSAIAAFDETLSTDPDNEEALRGKSRAYRRQSKFAEAQQMVTDGLKRLPNSVELLNEQGWIYYGQDEYDKAIAAFCRCLSIDPDNEEALRGKSGSYLIQRRFAEAQQVVTDGLKRLPNSVELLNEQGWIYYGQNEYDKAIRSFDQALNFDPDNDELLRWKSGAYRVQRKFAEAQQVVTDGLKRLPNSVELLNEQAWIYHLQREYDHAVAAFDRTLAADPDDEEALGGKSGTYRGQRKFAEAQQVVTDGLKRLPNSVELLNEQAWIYLNQREYDHAVAAFDRTLGADPDNADALVGKSGTYRIQRKFAEAQLVVTDRLKRVPNSVELLNERAWIYHNQREYDQAVAAFDRTLAADPDNADALGGKSGTYRIQRKFAEAQQVVTDGLKRLPNSVELLNEQGWIYYGQDEYNKAISIFDQVLSIDSTDENALDGKSGAYRLQRKFKEAQQVVTDGLQKLPDSVQLLNEQGWIYLGQDDYDKAIVAFDQVLSVDPDNEDALRWKSASFRIQRKFSEAANMLTIALERVHGSAELLIEQAWLDYELDKPAESEKRFAEVLQSHPGTLEAIQGRVTALTRVDRRYEALRLLQQETSARPNETDLRNDLGWFYFEQNEMEEARTEFERVLTEHPEDSNASNGLASVLAGKGMYDEAEERYRSLIRTEPDEPAFKVNLASLLVRRSDDDRSKLASAPALRLPRFLSKNTAGFAQKYLDEARELSEAALKQNSKYSSAYGCLGVIAFKQGRFLESENLFKMSAAGDPRDGQYTDLGALYVQMGRYEEAKLQFQKSLDIDKNSSRTLVELGNLNLQLDQSSEATRLFRQALLADPRNEEPPRALALALMKRGDYGEACRTLRRAIRELDESKRWRLYLALAQVMTEMADKNDEADLYEEALKAVREAVKLMPGNAEPYFHAGVVRFKLGDFRSALKNFRQCLRIDPDHFDAERNERLLRSLVREERRRTKGSQNVGFAMGALCLALLVSLWALYLHPAKSLEIKPDVKTAQVETKKTTREVTEAMLLTFSPILLGLSLVAFLLPWLIRLKLPGLEAELSQPTEKVSKGPTGSITFESPRISTGPR